MRATLSAMCLIALTAQAEVQHCFLDFFSGFELLPNGHVVVANWLGRGKHEKGPHLVEFNDANECVWQWKDHVAARQVTNVLMLN